MEKDHVSFGGVVKRDGNGPLVRGVAYEGKTPEEVYAEVSKHLKEWASPAKPEDAGVVS